MRYLKHSLSINLTFPEVSDSYASCISNSHFVDKVCGMKEHDVLVKRKLEEQYRLLGLVQKMLKLVSNMMMVPTQERGNATSVLEAVSRNYCEYPELRLGCCPV
jgi:hypothetical protein